MMIKGMELQRLRASFDTLLRNTQDDPTHHPFVTVLRCTQDDPPRAIAVGVMVSDPTEGRSVSNHGGERKHEGK
ncbi:MAG: hypothetical protein GC178_01865 [Flavobacteriales bacterium]|nr:hypothetical protein [Flavobacteriales bacterium]